MANIKLELDYTIYDGQFVLFKAPCNCDAVTGIRVYYPDAEGSAVYQDFGFYDAHNNSLNGLGDLFVEDAYVYAILDTTNSKAFLTNADTNGYLDDEITRGGTAFGLGTRGPQYATSSEIDGLGINTFFSYYNLDTPLVSGDNNTRYVQGICMSYGSNYAVQIIFCVYTGTKLVRKKSQGTWGSWLYENPPMTSGVEYPTTEQIRNGEIVWRKRVVYTNTESIGTAGTVSTLSFPHGISDFDAIVRATGKVTGLLLPYISNSGNISLVKGANATNIQVSIEGVFSANNSWDIDLAYVKSN